MSSETGNCALCGQRYDGHGHNPAPVLRHADDRVCGNCNEIVLSVRAGNKMITAMVAMYLVYRQVATNETMGDGGFFYADGKATLHAVRMPVEYLESLAQALGLKVYGRTKESRGR
jgi:hypothetical protein